MIAPLGDHFSHNIRTLFISDVHLGSRHSQSAPFLTTLRKRRPRTLYLVGDIVDGWRWPEGSTWKLSLLPFVRELENLVEAGTTIFYTPGNHDDFLRNPEFAEAVQRQLPFLNIADEFIHTALDGRRFLVTHGDQFDVVEQSAQWLSRMSSWAYDTALSSNRWLSRLIKHEERSPYWLCASGKKRVKSIIRFLSRFENSILAHARSRGCQGVICGHLHTPAIVHRDDMTYMNSGDWVENCTSLIETENGLLDLECFYPWTRRHSIIHRIDGQMNPSPLHPTPLLQEESLLQVPA